MRIAAEESGPQDYKFSSRGYEPRGTKLVHKKLKTISSKEASRMKMKKKFSMWQVLNWTKPLPQRETRTEDESITLKEKACRPVCRRRQWVMTERWNPLSTVTKNTSQVTKFRNKTLTANRLGLSWTDKGSKSSLTVRRRFKSTNSRLIMIEEVYKNWVKRTSRSTKNFIVLKQKNAVDKINFFMNSYWSKTGIFVKLMRKVSMKWKNWSDFKCPHSMNFRVKNWSKIETLSLNSQPRFRNYRMKLIAWMIREILKMLNQYAVDNPTLPVNLCLSHLIQFLVEC